jgi:hypothetical protein
MPPVGFELTIPASGRPQTYALDRAATGIGLNFTFTKFKSNLIITCHNGGRKWPSVQNTSKPKPYKSWNNIIKIYE